MIQHKINLFAAGFEDNVAAGLSLVEKRRALGIYRSNLDSLCPTEERRVNLCVPDDLKTIGGVYAMAGESVRLFAPGSVSRGIPHKEWEIPLTGIDLRSCGFYPDADIIAFAEIREATCVYIRHKNHPCRLTPKCSDMQIAIHLRALSDGGYHPVARYPTIRYSRKGLDAREIPFVSITSSKLAVLTRVQRGVSMVIWDWKSAEVLFVCQSLGVQFDRRKLKPRRCLAITATTLWSSSTIIGSWSALGRKQINRRVLPWWTRRRM